MPVDLPDVTVVVIDSVEPVLVRLAIEDTLQQITPAQVIVLTDESLFRAIGGDHWFVDQPARSYGDVASLLWYEVPLLVNTSHFLVMQWDGWVLDGERWDRDWLVLDYVGAPWGWHGGQFEVGNGGFSLRSTEMARWIARHPSAYPVNHPEDDVLCRVHRSALELDGFTWASVDQAEAFSFERTFPRPAFGFHGAWHWPHVMNRDRLMIRLEAAGQHVRGKPEWRELMIAARPVLAAG